MLHLVQCVCCARVLVPVLPAPVPLAALLRLLLAAAPRLLRMRTATLAAALAGEVDGAGLGHQLGRGGHRGQAGHREAGRGAVLGGGGVALGAGGDHLLHVPEEG